MKTRTFAAIVMTALLIMAMAGSAMCAPTELPDQAAQKAIDALQKEIDAKGYNWTAGITSVSGLSEDKKKKLCGVKTIEDVKEKGVKEKKQHPNKLEPVGTYPETFDWRDNGGNWMTSVKKQGCGDCWAFSVIGIVESTIKIQANDPNLDIDLSEQHLVSTCCSAGDCGGGWLDQSLAYMYYTGVPSEACFPYRGGNCLCTPCEIWSDNKWNIDSFSSANHHSVYKDRISSDGPLSDVIKVYEDFYSYTGGVYQHTTGDFEGYHAIIVVGWDDTENSWIIKNSWDTDWGENGYGRLTSASFATGYSAHTVGNISHYVPIAEASASPTNGTCPLTVAFSATGTDYDGTIVSYEWDFGDGANSTEQNPIYTYPDLGRYTATLTVTDDDGRIGFDNVVIINGEITTPISASASSYFDDDCLPENAIDGNITTYWLSSICDNPCQITFDFGEQVGIHSVYMSMRTGSGYSVFDVLVSDDATTWDVVSEDVSALDNDTAKVIVNVSQARYVKLDIDNPNVVEGCREFYAILASSTDPCEIYDTNGEPGIQKDEAINAMNDYLFLEIISKETAIAVMNCYLFPE